MNKVREEINTADEQALTSLVGAQLSAVWFFTNHVELQFETSRLTLTTASLPRVAVQGADLNYGMPSYRDMLSERIGKRVRAASVTGDQEIRIQFDDESTIALPLIPKHRTGAEAVSMELKPMVKWVWW